MIITDIRNTPLTEETLLKLASKYVDIKDIKLFKTIVCWFPPSMHKSLIQKLIRTRCESVEYGNKLYDPQVVMLTSLILLILNPGVFVPNIRRFVTGIESATKRLAVSICEDSYTEKADVLMGLYTSAMIAQDDRNWLPTDEAINSWFVVALESQRDHRAYKYNFRTFDKNIKQFDFLSVSYFVLDEIRSFKSDIDMVGSISQNGGIPKQTTNNRIKIMPLTHALDHHSFTEIAHYLPYTGQPYKEVFSNIWNQVVGVNPRYSKYSDYYNIMEKQPFVSQVRTAQRDVWISKMYKQTLRESTSKTIQFSYKLDLSWLAGLVGPIEIRMSGFTAIVVLKVDNIYEMTAVKRPQRDTKANPELTELEQIESIRQAKILLSRGIKLDNVPKTIPLLIKATVRLDNNRYIITLSDGNNYLWETVINLVYNFPIHPSLLPTIYNSLLYTGNGLDINYLETMNYLILYPANILRRLSTYLSGYKSKIELAKISRDGSGTYYQVMPEDTAVNKILCYLCVMYPAAIMKTKFGFQVKTGPLLWSIRDSINQHMSKTLVFQQKWPIPSEEKRKRWDHQISSFNQMVKRNKAGKKGHLIWIPVGLGKTVIAIDYLDYLIKQNKMPSYCVYSLPSSAINNIIIEFKLRNLPTKLIDARSTSKLGDNVIEPYKVCLIKHDHMRLGNMEQQLKNISKDTVFIVDEFHKTLSKTIRTSIALEMTRLSHDFIGMSGTIIKDTNYDELIQWLEQIVEFEVTEKNYWVAIGALVSRKVYTQVVVERLPTPVKMNSEISKLYYEMVPEKLGGTARMINFKGAVDLSYQVVTQAIVSGILGYIKINEGVFVVAKNIKHQNEIKDNLIKYGMKTSQIHLFSSDSQVTLTPEYKGPIKVVITTKTHSEGYTLTKFRVMITSVYFSNQATREQLEGRINRLGQTSSTIRIIIYHAGILSYIHEKYEKARSLSEALKGFAGEVGIDPKLIKFN